MSANPGSLKSKNQIYIRTMLIADIAIVFTVLHQDQTLPLFGLQLLTLNNAIFIAAVTVITILINHLLPRWVKEIIAHLRIKNVQPGCRAFSERAFKDKRINITSLKNNIGRFPSSASKQNALWYKLLKQHESKASIQYAHQIYLLFRDGATISLIICLLLALPLLLYTKSMITTYIFIGLLIQYIAFMIAAQNSGNSLVDNVLAEASCSTTNI